MQYVGRAIGSVSKTWSSINPATLSGAIDVIVVEHESGEMYCSPFHVRFGKFQLFRPSQKKVDFIVNGEVTDIPMKLGDEGEAFFVFETDGYVPEYLQTSPVLSAASSPSSSPKTPPSSGVPDDMEYLDIGEGVTDSNSSLGIFDKHAENNKASVRSIERARNISRKLTKKNIPSKVEANGDILLDMEGYKSENRDVQDYDAYVKQLLKEEFGEDIDLDSFITDLDGNIRISTSSEDDNNTSNSNSNFLDENLDLNSSSPPLPSSSSSSSSPPPAPPPAAKTELYESSPESAASLPSISQPQSQHDIHFKTLRLTSEQLKCLSLKYGENDIQYSVNKGKSIITTKLYLWKSSIPIVISDIDGTITKSDALGHVLTMLGRDWTHVGVAKLFSDIEFNGYNIMYLTARSVGLADITRSYLNGVEQDGVKLPSGPVILSPDRTIAALRREIVLKKPEVFKMACLNDIRALYYPGYGEGHELDNMMVFGKNEDENENEDEGADEDEDEDENGSGRDSESIIDDDFTDINTNTGSYTNGEDEKSIGNSSTKRERNKINENGEFSIGHKQYEVDETNTPFYAGFGNRITDAISYRSVGIPSSRIFTINPDGDVKMELLEMAGFKSNYVSIGELVDQFFPPVTLIHGHGNGGEDKNGIKNVNGEIEMKMSNAHNKFSDVNFWRNPVADLSLISEDEEDSEPEKDKENRIDTTSTDSIKMKEGKNETKTDKTNNDNSCRDDKESTTLSLSPTSSTGATFGLSSRGSSTADSSEHDKNKGSSRLLSPTISNFFMRSPVKKPEHIEGVGSGAGSDEPNKADNHEQEESDPDYVYEEGSEDEDEDEDEDEFDAHSSIFGDEEAEIEVPYDEDDEDEGEDEGEDDLLEADMNGLLIKQSSRHNSVSGINNDNVHGTFY